MKFCFLNSFFSFKKLLKHHLKVYFINTFFTVSCLLNTFMMMLTFNENVHTLYSIVNVQPFFIVHSIIIIKSGSEKLYFNTDI